MEEHMDITKKTQLPYFWLGRQTSFV